ncbi:MAG: anion transporter [Candidatus Korarchaeota archaeon]|nr:anion transporter [Candidatus Korarchaeota archaeon]
MYALYSFLFLKEEKILLVLVTLYAILFLADIGFPLRSPSYINVEAIPLIISFMLISKLLEFSGAFSRISGRIISLSGWKMLLLLLMVSELAAAILMNDTALFFVIPLIVTLSRVAKTDFSDLAIILTVAVNIGSALTPISNPQNIIIWNHFHLSFTEFITAMFPFFLLSTGFLLITTYVYLGKSLHINRVKMPPIALDYKLMLTSILLLIVNVMLAQYGAEVLGVVLTVLAALLMRRKLLLKLDYPLILIFCLIFMDFSEISHLINYYGILPTMRAGCTVILISSLLS